jgi:hypothetical protein
MISRVRLYILAIRLRLAMARYEKLRRELFND